jgi:serine/threonine protein kinase
MTDVPRDDDPVGPTDSQVPPAAGHPGPDAGRTQPALDRVLDAQSADWGHGQGRPVEEYLAGQPALAQDPAAVLDLIYHQVLLRRRRGEAPALEGYLRRFPRLAEQLPLLFEVDQAVGPGPGSTPGTAPAQGAATSPGGPPPGTGLPAVPGYELLGKLGQGGMGVVYKARQVRAGRLVALKMMRAGADTEKEFLARFRREAEAAARLQHPHMVPIYEVGEHDGRPFFSMELCPGGSLADRLAGTPLPARQAAELVEALALALDAAHQVGVIHRDLKPANVLLAADGTPKVADFGLAKQVETGAGLTQTGAILGTPSYMAPEQASGRSKEVGPHTDVYALGAVLYECLTGRPPFQGADLLDVLEQVRSQEPVPPRLLNREVPPNLQTICLKCLEKEGGHRYPTAQLLVEDLRRFLVGDPISTMKIGEREWLARCAKRAGYEILDELGRGGMGIVYKARQISLDRLVALKLIRRFVYQPEGTAAERVDFVIDPRSQPERAAPQGKASPEAVPPTLPAEANDLARQPPMNARELARLFRLEDRPVHAATHVRGRAEWQLPVAEVERFYVEAHTMARLRHPHIVQIYDCGEQNGLLWFSMELIKGGSLAQKLNDMPLSVREAAQLVETLARAIHVVHEKGVIHRDLKPANVLLTADGTPKITDFGLVKRPDLERDGRLIEEDGSILGTPSYMAPEQAAGKSKEVGPATGVYALGALLYECLTGRPPFGAATVWETMRQVLGEEPVPPRQLQPKVPRDLEQVCLKCLQKEPALRYASALALAEALRDILGGGFRRWWRRWWRRQ